MAHQSRVEDALAGLKLNCAQESGTVALQSFSWRELCWVLDVLGRETMGELNWVLWWVELSKERTMAKYCKVTICTY